MGRRTIDLFAHGENECTPESKIRQPSCSHSARTVTLLHTESSECIPIIRIATIVPLAHDEDEEYDVCVAYH